MAYKVVKLPDPQTGEFVEMVKNESGKYVRLDSLPAEDEGESEQEPGGSDEAHPRKTRGRPKKEASGRLVQVSILLPADLKDDVVSYLSWRTFYKGEKVAFNAFVRQLLEHAIKKDKEFQIAKKERG